MRLLLVGENPRIPSGFGMQISMLATGLKNKGHDVIVLASNPPSYFEDGIEVWYNREVTNIENLDVQITKIKPDAAILFYHTQFVKGSAFLSTAPKNCPVLLWLPWEGTTLPHDGDKYFIGMPEDKVVHLSEFARDLWKDQYKSDPVIPHMLDTTVFYPQPNPTVQERARLRQKWSINLRFPLFDDSLIVLNLDRNIWHKRWDATFDYVKRLQKAIPDKRVQLIAHTIKHSQGHPLAHDLEKLAKLQGVYDSVVFTDFDWFKGRSRDDLRELYWLCDFRLSTSEGEGFGVPTIEAAACKCPQILNRSTTIPELVGDDYVKLVDPALSEEKLGSIWQVPDIKAMVRKTKTLYRAKGQDQVKRMCADAYDHVMARFSVERVVSQWDKLLEERIICADELWYESRWGWTAQTYLFSVLKKLPELLKRLSATPSVLEVGSFTKVLVEACMEHNIKVAGIEPDYRAFEKSSSLAKLSMVNAAFTSKWPVTDILVLTDVFDLIVQSEQSVGVLECYNRFKQYEWILIRRKLIDKWKLSGVNPADIEAKLGETHTRRYDLENIAKQKLYPELAHEIWHVGDDTTVVPPKMVELLEQK